MGDKATMISDILSFIITINQGDKKAFLLLAWRLLLLDARRLFNRLYWSTICWLTIRPVFYILRYDP